MATLNGAKQGSVLEMQDIPVAAIAADPEIGIVGSVVKLDGRASSSPGGAQLTYSWSFAQVPIGSLVAHEGFRQLDDDGGLVSFSPDRVGEYILALSVSNGVYSGKTTRRVSIRGILVPDGRGIVPDGKFIWSYIRDVWQGVENREVFETLWSALVQTCGAELLKTYEADFNKSIRDIQSQSQKRWLCYEPKLELVSSDLKFYLGNESAGRDASTETLGLIGKAVLLGPNEVVVTEGSVIPDAVGPFEILYSRGAQNIGKWLLRGATSDQSGYMLDSVLPDIVSDRMMEGVQPVFEFQSVFWNLGLALETDYALQLSMYPSPIDQLSGIFTPGGGSTGDIRRGDVIHIPDGINKGFYRIVNLAGASVEVDHPAPMASIAADVATIYRPVGFSVQPAGALATSSLTVPKGSGAELLDLLPGRVITVGGRTVPFLRAYEDEKNSYPVVVARAETETLVPEQTGLLWRIPCTLESSSQDFELLGISAGDLLVADIIRSDSTSVFEMKCQVTGVAGNKLGFILTVEKPTPGSDYVIPDQVFVDFCARNNITHVELTRDGRLVLSGKAKALWDFLQGTGFAPYLNVELTPETELSTPVGDFTITPKAIVRNSLIPLDPLVRSIPTLQEWIVQPTVIEKSGKFFQVRGSSEFELARKPSVLIENNDFTIDGETAFDETLTFMTGSDVLELDGISFIDRRVAPGDVVRIHDVATYAEIDFKVVSVISQSKVKVFPPIPRYVGDGLVTSRVSLTRRRGGTFLRIVPGGFSAKAPAPNRYWAEVSYIDNSEAIESNFGIMVGLTRDDMDKVSSRLDYRQAVTGLMFAYTRGSAVEKIRLGAQILLGLPFAEHRGIIRSIEPDYRLDSKGVPIQGRILIEDVDSSGAPSGIQRIYLYPVDLVSVELSGIEDSPVTGKPYVVGDVVETFAPLAKGVAVTDYMNGTIEEGSVPQRYLQQFHSYQMKANDNIFDLEEVGLVSSFLRRITPSYVSFFLTSLTEVSDQVAVNDHLVFRFPLGGAGSGFIDIAGLGMSTPAMYDQVNYNKTNEIFWDDGIFMRRTSGQEAVMSLSSNIVSIPAGGLLVSESFTPTEEEGIPVIDEDTNSVFTDDGDQIFSTIPTSLVRNGDYLFILEGFNKGRYPILAVTNFSVTIDVGSTVFAADTSPYYIGRPLRGSLRSGSVVSVTPDTVPPVPAPGSWQPTVVVKVDSGLRVDGVMPGDWLLVSDGTKYVRFPITKVESSSTVRVVGSSVPVGDYRIVRPELLPNPIEDVFVLESDGAQYTSIDALFFGLAEQGDSLVMEQEGLPRVLVVEPLGIHLRPVLPAGQYLCQLSKQSSQASPIGFDIPVTQLLLDLATITVRPVSTVASAAGVYQVNLGTPYTEIEPRVGDFIKFLQLNQVDNGYGVGVYPIVDILPGSTSVALAFPMSDTGPSTWALIRRS